MDDLIAEAICDQVTENITHVTSDKIYDTNPVFQTVESHFPGADIVISAGKSNAITCGAMSQKRRYRV